MSTIISYLWGIVNGLQLIAMTSLFRIKLPTNVQVVFVEILKLAAFDLFQTETIYMKIFRFSKTESFSTSFDEAAFSGSNFIIGIGSMFLFIVFYALYLCTRWMMIRWFSDVRQCKPKIIPWFRNHNIEATCIRFILEGNIDILLNALICILYMKNKWSFGDKFQDKGSNLFGFIMLIILCYAPIHALARSLQFRNLQKKKHTSKAERILLKEETKRL